jgi:hypothetical protein
MSLCYLGKVLTTRGEISAADHALGRTIHLFQQQHKQQPEGLSNAFRAELALHQGRTEQAHGLANRAWQLTAVDRYARDFICAVRWQGTAPCAWATSNRPTSACTTPAPSTLPQLDLAYSAWVLTDGRDYSGCPALALRVVLHT